jgi:hypothetical protein
MYSYICAVQFNRASDTEVMLVYVYTHMLAASNLPSPLLLLNKLLCAVEGGLVSIKQRTGGTGTVKRCTRSIT